jgi:hypothetical protein
MAAKKRARAPESKKVTLSAKFRKQYDGLLVSAALPDVDEVVRRALRSADIVYSTSDRGMTLEDLALDFLPHVEAALKELARVGALRYLPRARAYVPGRVSDAEAAARDVEGGGGASAKPAGSMPAALERLAKAMKTKTNEKKR